MATSREIRLARIIARRIARRNARKGTPSSSGLGPIYVKPSEVPSLNNDARRDAVVVSGTVTNPIYKDTSGRVVTSSGGSSSRVKQAQIDFAIAQARQRQIEQQRQAELQRLQLQNDQIRAEKLRQQIARQKLLENKKLKEKAERIKEEQNRLKDRVDPKNIQEGIKQEDIRQEKEAQKNYVPTKDKFGRTEEYYIQAKIQKELNTYTNNLRKALQSQIDAGIINVDEANEQLTKAIDHKGNQIQARLDNQFKFKSNYKLEKSEFARSEQAKLKSNLQKFQEKLENLTFKIDTRRSNLRGEIPNIPYVKYDKENKRRLKTKLEVKNELRRKIKTSQLLSLALAKTGLENLKGALFIAEVVSNPTTRYYTKKAITSIVVDKTARGIFIESLVESGDKFYNLVINSPGEAFMQIGGEIVIGQFVPKGSTKIFKSIKKATTPALDAFLNLNPRLLRIEQGIIKISKKLSSGNEFTLKVGTIADTKEGMAKQLARGGKTAIGVTAQADGLVGFIRRTKLIRKPFSGEDKLSKVTRDLLKKFDKKQITSKEILELNLRLRKETKKLGVQEKGIDLLERSAYFDPDRTLRKSRLQLGQKDNRGEGTLLDLLTGKASLFNKKLRPQILVIEDLVEKLPRTKEFASIRRKLKASKIAGKDPNLTKLELAKLSRWQVTPSGKLKPIGSTTYQGGLERELTIAPGEVIKRVKKLGTVIIDNKRIPIYAIKIIKDTKKIAKIKKITKLKKEINNLKQGTKKRVVKEKQIRKIETKEIKEFLTQRRRSTTQKKVFPTTRKASSTARRTARLKSTRKRTASRRTPTRKITASRRTPTRGRVTPRKRTTPKRTTPKRRPTPRKPRPRKPIPRGRVTPRPRATPPAKRKTTPPIRRRKSKKPVVKRKKKGKQGYNVYVKAKKKYIKANKKPLSKKNAQDRRAYVVDHSTSARARLKPVGKYKKLGKITTKEKNARKKIKARNYRIIKGRKVYLSNTIIERKGKPRINTRGEKRGLQASRVIAQLNNPKKKKVVKRKKKK